MSRAAIAALLLAGCTVGPNYSKPAVNGPSSWGEKVDQSSPDLQRWWTLFRDPTLDALVMHAMNGNLDVKIARARVREARAQVGVVSGALLPEIGADGSVTRTRTSQNTVFGRAGFPSYSNTFSAGFDASWELDLFGGTRRAVEAASADAEAAAFDEKAVLVSLLGDVARNYIEARGAQRQLAVLNGNIASAKGTVDLTKARLQAGVATSLDVARAEALRATVESQIPPVERALRQSIFRLGVLVGREPKALAEELLKEAPIPVPPPDVVAGLPSELLDRRPDVRRADRALAAAIARVGEATAEYFPKFSLLGTFAWQSVGTGDWFTWPSRAWTAGPSVRWALFQGGRIAANVEVRNAQVDEAMATFQRSFLLALEDVENALVAWFREWDRHRALGDAVAADRRAAELAEELYKKGLASFLDVLEAQRTLYGAELQVAESDAAVSVNLVALYKALGGGWDPSR